MTSKPKQWVHILQLVHLQRCHKGLGHNYSVVLKSNFFLQSSEAGALLSLRLEGENIW